MSVLPAVVAGAARHQPAHGMSHQRDLGHLGRPGGNQLLEQARKSVTVLGHVQPGVVSDLDRRVPQLAL